VDLRGKRVGVIGTGSSGIQAIPELAEVAGHLTVFQRTPAYSLPARNRPLSSREIWVAQRDYDGLRESGEETTSGVYITGTNRSVFDDTPEQRAAEFERRWVIGGTEMMRTYADTGRDRAANEIMAQFIRDKIHEIVRDPETAEALTPRDYPMGAKRICVDSDYFATYNRGNVTLVDLRRDPIVSVTETGIDTERGSHELDVLVYATGYDAMTGALTRIEIRGADGDTLAQRWKDGPTSMLGIAVAGFPNLFTLTGPGSPSVLANVIRANEQHVDWTVALLEHMRENGYTRVEADPAAQEEWAQKVHDAATRTLYLQARSWYVGANIEGKPRRFMPYIGGFPAYRAISAKCARDGYPGFHLTNGARPASAGAAAS
jgi:cyclohexanone monooxygenase